MTAPDPLTLAVIRTRGEFDAMEREWDDLVESSGMASPFLFHGWFACCLDRDPDRALAVLIAREGGRVVGIAPLWSWVGRRRGLRLRLVGFISCPETGVADLIVRPQVRETVVEALLGRLFTLRDVPWDAAALAQWPERSPNWSAARALAARLRWLRFEDISSITPYIQVTGGWEEYLASKTYLFRKSKRGILNRMTRQPGVTVERVREEQEGIVQDLTQISERGWKHSEGYSLSSSDASRIFFQALTRVAARKGWLDLWILRIGGVPVAFEYDLSHGGVVHALRAEYDEAYARQSPGAYLEYLLLRACFDEGARRYSCGPGLDSYKLRWTEERDTNRVLTLCNWTLPGCIHWCLEAAVIPRLRRLRRLGGPPEEPAA